MGPDFLRKADWLTARRARAYLWILATLNAVTIIAVVATSRNGVDSHGYLLGTDFLSFWTVGHMLAAGGNAYDQAAHIAAQQAYFTQADAFTAFFYPPGFLPFCYPLGWLSYFPALALWLLMTGALFWFALSRWLRLYPITVPTAVLLAAFTATVVQVTHGQTAFLTGGLLLLASLWVRPAPIAAGALLGLATIKPQFGVLIPLVLVLTGEWRTIGAAALAALGLAGLSATLFGAEVWADWYALTRAAQTAMDAGTVGYAKMVSPLAGAMLIGLPSPVGYAVQAAVSLTIVIMLAMVSWRRGYTPELGALTLVGAVLVTPFVLDYDLLLLAPAMIVIVAQGARGGFRSWEKLAVFLAFAAPAFARPIGMNLHLPTVPEIAFLLFWVLWRRLRTASSIESLDHA